MPSVHDPRAQAAAAGVLLLLPLIVAVLGVEALALQDLPQHVLVAGWAATPADALPPAVTPREVSPLAPYRLLYAALGAFGPRSAPTLARWLVVLYLVGGAAATAWVVSRRPGGDLRLAVACVPALAGCFLWSGFLTWLAALPVWLALLGCLLTLDGRRATGPLAWPLAGALAALAALYLLHPLALALGVTGCALGAAPALRDLRQPTTRGRAAAQVAPLVVGAPLAAVALRWAGQGGAGPGLLSELWTSAGAGLGHGVEVLLRLNAVHYAPGRRGLADLGAGLVVVGLLAPHLAALRAEGWRRLDPRRASVGVWLLAGSAAVAAAATLVFPWVFAGLAYAGPRFALPAWLAGVALLAARAPAGRGRRVGVALTWLGSALLVGLATQALTAVSAEQRPLVELGHTWAAAGEQPRVVSLDLVERSRVVDQVWHLERAAPGQALIACGGVPAQLFSNPFLPVAVEPLALPARPWDYDPAAGHGRGATHVLLRAPPADAGVFADVRRRLGAAGFAPVAQAGAWEVWQAGAPR